MLHVAAGRSEQEEVAVVAGGFVSQQAHAEIGLLVRVEKLEVGVGLQIGGFVTNHGLVRPVAFDFDFVAWGVDGLEGTLGFQIHFHADRLNRTGGVFFGVEREEEIHQAAVGLEKLRVGKRDVLAGVGLNGKNANLE